MKRMFLALVALCLSIAPSHAAEVEVEGFRVHYSVQGSGSTIIFVHGWTCDETSWRLQVPTFARDHRVITIDLPGHGRSQVPAQDKFSMRLFAAAVEGVRAKVGASRVVLVGHSLGATVIGYYARKYPQHVAGLVAADGSLYVAGLPERPAGLPTMNRERREAMIGSMFVASTPAALRAEIRKMMLAAPDATANGTLNTMYSADIRPEKPVLAPALSITATMEQPWSDEVMKGIVPKWKSAAMPGAGHFLMMEKPAEFNRLLAGFIKDRAVW